MRDLLEFYLLAPGIAGGDVKKAEAVAKQIAAIDVCEGSLAKARIAEFRKDLKETEAALRHGADACPSSYKSQVALAEFLAAGHRDEKAAEALAKTAISKERERTQAYAILAAIYAGREDWDSLEAILASAAEAVPDDPAPYYRAAERLLADGRDPARTERYLHTYLEQDPEGNQPTAADARSKLGAAVRAQNRGNSSKTRSGGVN